MIMEPRPQTDEAVCLWYSDIGQRIPALRLRLGQMGYPAANRTLLGWLHSYFEQCENFPPGKFPNQEHVKALVQEFVFYRSVDKNVQHMNSMQELQLLKELCHYFDDNADLATLHNTFDALFGNSGHPLNESDEQRRQAMLRLVSMAISLGCKAVLDCTAVWMYNQDCSSHSISLADSVTTDFCELSNDVPRAVLRVAEMCPKFTYHLLTALMSHYNTYQSKSHPIKLVPPGQLQVITEWISEQPIVCLRQAALAPPPPQVPPFHIHASRKSSTQHHQDHHEPSNSGPLPGMVWQSVLAPLIIDANRDTIRNSLGERLSVHDYSLLFSKLHLGILQSFVTANNPDAKSSHSSLSSKTKVKSGALTLTDIESVVMLTVHFVQDNRVSKEAVNTAVGRIAQLLQVAMVMGMLNASKEKVLPLCKELPENDLLTLVLHGKLPS